MGGVSLPVMQVVDMIAMRHRGVSATMLVPVFVAVDGHVLRDLAFCPLPLPLTVHVTVVGVVDVVGVLESHMSTAFAVLVAVSSWICSVVVIGTPPWSVVRARCRVPSLPGRDG